MDPKHLEDVRYEVDRGLAWITIARPDRLNAFRGRTVDELIACFKAAWADRDVGVVALTGEGDRAFCAGGDVVADAVRRALLLSSEALKTDPATLRGQLTDRLAGHREERVAAWARCASVITGPSTVSGSYGSPTFNAPAIFVRPSTTWS